MKKIIAFIVFIFVAGGASALWYFGTYVFEKEEAYVYAEETKELYYPEDIEEVTLNLFRGLEGIDGLELVKNVVVSRANSDSTYNYKNVDLVKFLEPGKDRAEIFVFKDTLRGWEVNKGASYDEATGVIELDQKEQNKVFGQFVTTINREDEAVELQNTITDLETVKMGKIGLMELAFTYSRAGDYGARSTTNKTICDKYQERCEDLTVNLSGKVAKPDGTVEKNLSVVTVSHLAEPAQVGSDGAYELSVDLKAYDHLVFVVSNDGWTTGPIAMPVGATEESISNFNLFLSPR